MMLQPRGKIDRQYVDIVVRQHDQLARTAREAAIVRLCERPGIAYDRDFVRQARVKSSVQIDGSSMFLVIDRTDYDADKRPLGRLRNLRYRGMLVRGPRQ